MRPMLRFSLVLALVAGGSCFANRPLLAQNAADPAAVAKAEEAQKAADAAIAKRVAAEAAVAAEQAKVKVATQAFARAKAGVGVDAGWELGAGNGSLLPFTCSSMRRRNSLSSANMPASPLGAVADLSFDLSPSLSFFGD